MKNIYLDNAATTRPDERVVEAMMPYLRDKYGNASSVHRWGREAKVLVEDARDAVAEFIGAKSSEIYFTSGGTEANNWGILGTAFRDYRLQIANYRLQITDYRLDVSGSRLQVPEPGVRNHVIATKIEHSCVLDTLEYLRERFGFEVTYVPTNRYGLVNPEDVKNTIRDKTFLICMMHSNNELGVINDIAEIARIAQERGIHLHTDSVQSIGKTKFNVRELNCTTATLSAHKIYGTKGIGALYIKKGTPVDKFHHGGKQERDRRGGTENVAAIAGFKKAVEILKGQMDEDIVLYKKLRERLIKGLTAPPLTPPQRGGEYGIIVNSPKNGKYLYNIVNISFDMNKMKIDPETLLIKLDMKGIAVSSGSACTSGTIQPSHVLKAIGYDDVTAKSSLRVSFGRENTVEEVEYFVKVLKEII